MPCARGLRPARDLYVIAAGDFRYWLAREWRPNGDYVDYS